MTALRQNSFYILGASPRDDRRRIVSLAEEKLLHVDETLCSKARDQLTNPRGRLEAEVSWLPGLSPRRAEELVKQLDTDSASVLAATGLPVLSKANLVSASLEKIGDAADGRELATVIAEFARLVNSFDADAIMRDINEDRLISGFAPVQRVELITNALATQKQHYLSVLRRLLDSRSTTSLVALLTAAVDETTNHGMAHAPELIDELVDLYEVQATEFFDREALNVTTLIAEIRSKASNGEDTILPLVEKLGKVVQNWDEVAQPIQVSMKARGITHRRSAGLANELRGLAVDLWNEHQMLVATRKLNELLLEVFAELPTFSERFEADANAIEKLAVAKESADRDAEAAKEALTYSTEIGLIFRRKLRISPEGIEWGGDHYPLDAITHVRWGGVKHSVNGIPTGTNYTIAFGDSKSESVVETRTYDVYSEFTTKLWAAVCSRLCVELLRKLEGGQEIDIGGTRVADDGITLRRGRFFAKDEFIKCTWDDVTLLPIPGGFIIRSKSQPKCSAEFSSINTRNAHILDHVIRIGFKNGVDRLSELLD